MEITWSPQSLEDLNEIGDFIAEDSPENAALFIDKIINSVERLVEFPESGQIIEENPMFRHLVYQGYRLIYQLRTEQVLIITVLAPGRAPDT